MPSSPDDHATRDRSEAQTALVSRPPIEPLVLRPTLARRAAVALLGAGAVAFAVAAHAWVVVAIASIGIAGTWTLLGRRRIRVDADGIHVSGFGGRRTLRWGDVAYYTYWSAFVIPSAVRIGGPRRRIRGASRDASFTRHDLIVYGSDGTSIRVDSHVRDAAEAIATILDVLHVLLRETATFQPFAIEEDGLRHERSGLLAWRKLEDVVVDNQTPPRLIVHANGKAFAWASESMEKVHNGLLLVENLVERGVAVDLERDVLVHDRLDELIQRNRQLPRARIVRG